MPRVARFMYFCQMKSPSTSLAVTWPIVWTSFARSEVLIRASGWLETTSAEDRRDLLDSLIPDAEATQTADDWESAFRVLAHALVQRFAGDLRGFRRSSDRFVVERFLSTPGRVLLEPERVFVSLRSNPLWVAVHASGGDLPVDSADWLGGRRVEFELEGL